MTNVIQTLIFNYWREIQIWKINQEYKDNWHIGYYTELLTRCSGDTGGHVSFMNFRYLNICCKRRDLAYSNFVIKNISGNISKCQVPDLYFCSNTSCVCKKSIKDCYWV